MSSIFSYLEQYCLLNREVRQQLSPLDVSLLAHGMIYVLLSSTCGDVIAPTSWTCNIRPAVFGFLGGWIGCSLSPRCSGGRFISSIWLSLGTWRGCRGGVNAFRLAR